MSGRIMTIENEQLIEVVREMYEKSDARVFELLHQIANIAINQKKEQNDE